MTALAASRPTKTLLSRSRSVPVAASVTIYEGSLVAFDTSGYARPARVSTSDRIIGRCTETVTNGTTAGAVSVNVDSDSIARFAISSSSITQAHIGRACFAVDDQTVSLTDNANTRCRVGRIYQVDSSGVWIDFISQPVLVPVTVTMADISTADTVYVPCPVSGTVTKVMATLKNAITVADSICTSGISGVAITGGGFTAAYTASAAGTTFTATPTAANTVAVGQYLSFTTDGASTTTAITTVTFLISVG